MDKCCYTQWLESEYTMENTEALWITTEECRPHQHSISEHGIQWTIFSQLEDLDYADNNAFISHNSKSSTEEGTASHSKSKENWASDKSEKTKVMCMNLKERIQIKIDKEELEVVTDFTHLGSNIIVAKVWNYELQIPNI